MNELSESDKAKMDAARVLIQEKRYAEARALLTGIKHPKATDWILRLDALQGKAKSQVNSTSRYLWGGLSLISFVLFFPTVYLAVKGDYPGNAIAGGLALIFLIAAYVLNRMARRNKR